MQGSFAETHIPDQDSDLETKLSQMNLNTSSQDFYEEEVEKETTTNDDDAHSEDGQEFSFTCGGADTSPIAAEDAFIDGKIKPIFPLFDRDFYSAHDESDSLHENMPTKPLVKKFFVETKDRADRKAVEVSPEVCKKSNSTGFSKIWRFKDFLGRSNSDGRDAFVFLNDRYSHSPAVSGKKVAEKKVKMASLSAHEVYLRSKAKDGEKRRSYLPYRPELMGFFTNVNGGLSKNVHPY